MRVTPADTRRNSHGEAFGQVLLVAGLQKHIQGFLFSQQSFTFRGVTMRNHNGLLGRMPGVDGLKTGHTEEAGFCLVASAVREGARMITSVFGTANESARAAETQKLLDEMDKEQQKLVKELIPGKVSLGAVQRILQNLLQERVSIRDLPTIQPFWA